MYKRLAPRRLGAVVAALVLSASALAACGGDDSSAADGKITIGFLPTAGLAPIVRAQEANYFADEDLDVERVNLKSPADSIANLASGESQLALINTGSMAAAIQQGIDIEIVTALYYFNPEGDQGIWAPAGSSISRPKDLEGKTVAMGALQNNFQAFVVKAIEGDGGDPSKVDFTLVSVPDIPGTLRNGTADAGQVAEPFIAQNKADLTPVIEYPAEVLGPEASIVGYVVTTSAFADSDPDTIASFRDAYNKAVDDLSADDELARDTIAGFTELDPALLSEMVLPVWKTDLDLDNAQAQIDLMEELGYLEESVEVADHVFD